MTELSQREQEWRANIKNAIHLVQSIKSELEKLEARLQDATPLTPGILKED